MVNYQNGIIYRIYDNTNGDVYYGSTANILRVRMSKHKSDAKNEKKICKSKSIILNDDYFYNEVEKYPCNSKKELETRERYYIENFTCVNKQVPTRTPKEWREDHKEDIKEYHSNYYNNNKQEIQEYYQDNKEQLLVYSKKYYEDHKKEIQEYYKKYHQDNKEEIKEYNKKYYDDNKEEIKLKSKVPHNCLCGGKYTFSSKARHNKSKKHQKYITDNAPICIECK
tara:strand:- start:940 stop:1614 length:675 start_codon:yes stop_codon:yes gene_type:complete